MSDTQYKILNKENKGKSELVVEVEVNKSFIEEYKDESLKDFKSEMEIDGFRKGQVPDNMVIQKVGEMAIWEKASYKALNNVVPLIIVKEKIDALTQPEIAITKITPNDTMTFKMTLTLMPEVELADYKKIAKGIEKTKQVELTDKEVDDYIDYIRKQRGDSVAMAENKKIDKDTPLPEFNDEFVKTLGDFSNVEEFKTKLKENMLQDKQTHENQKRRLSIIEKIISESKIEVPDVLVEKESEHMLSKFKFDIENMKMKYEDYLVAIKKSEDDLKKEWKTDAEKRVKMNLVLPKIAQAEKLKANDEDVKKEVAHLKEHNPEVDEMHATTYVQNVLTNEEVFKFLETVS